MNWGCIKIKLLIRLLWRMKLIRSVNQHHMTANYIFTYYDWKFLTPKNSQPLIYKKNKKQPFDLNFVFIYPFQTNKAVWLGMELVVVDLWGGIGGLLPMMLSLLLFAIRKEHEPLWEPCIDIALGLHFAIWVSPITPP